jgi:hypothetical protein
MKRNNINKTARNGKSRKINKLNNRLGGAYTLSGRGYTNFERPSLTFIDPSKFVVMRYFEEFTNAMTTGAGAQQLMRLNSIFDPNSTGSGHNPYGYDQLAPLYNRYRVLRTHYKIVFGNQAGSYNIVVIPINGALSSAITNNTTFESACEVPFSKKFTQAGGGAPTVVISGMIELCKLNGVRPEEYLADDRFEAQIGANPAEVINLVIGTYNPTGSTINATYTVELLFEVHLHDPISVAGS